MLLWGEVMLSLSPANQCKPLGEGTGGMASSSACQPSGSRTRLESINAPVRAILKDSIRSLQKRKSRSAAAYIEAYSSLKACPMPFATVHELSCLSGFVPAIVRDVKQQLVQWCEDNGRLYIESPTESRPASPSEEEDNHEDDRDNETDSDFDKAADGLDKVRKIRVAPRKRLIGEGPFKNKTGQKQPRATKAKPAKVPKSYIPQHRTGTHGILVALFTLTTRQPSVEDHTEADKETEAGVEYYSKATIIHFAQPYSDAKYAVKQSAQSNGFGASFHSAWTGMKTLINRGYVYRRGNPARFGLSHEGWAIAQICTEREKGLKAGCNVDRLSSVPIASAGKESNTKDKESRPKDSKVCNEGSSSFQDARPFLYTYLTDTEPPTQTNLRKEASVRLSDGDYRMMYRIIFPKELSEHPFVASCVKGVGMEGSAVYGWVKESACNEVAPGYTAQSPEQTGKETTEVRECDHSGQRDRAPSKSRVPLQAVKSNKNIQQPPLKKVKQSTLTETRVDVIELLTSSDVESDGRCNSRSLDIGKTATRAKARVARCSIDSGSDSGSSTLSDLVPKKNDVVRKRRIAKIV